MTTIGLGIDPFFGATTSQTPHATVAAVKAVRDAMERGILRFPTDHSNLYLHIQLGVPSRSPHNPTEPLPVDIGHLTPLLPSFIPLLFPVQVVVGGLLVNNNNNNNSTIDSSNSSNTLDNNKNNSAAGNACCTAVACISLQRAHPTVAAKSSLLLPPPTDGGISPTSVTGHGTVKADSSSLAPSFKGREKEEHSPSTTWAPDEEEQEASAYYDPRPASSGVVHKSKSIDMLAQISSELHEQPTRLGHARSASCSAMDQALAQATPDDVGYAGQYHNDNDDDDGDDDDDNKMGNYHYLRPDVAVPQKLPPGNTSKNNTRLFVQHRYRDFAQETPLPDERHLVGPNAPFRSPTAAFPLKLHETLTVIELAGLSHIIGWLPHGRSFKIFKQKEFVESILPKYFVMTKKSSFLRQLNLYGFNRLSGLGPDQGSYYHEKFLRGIKFLSRRISRQKVNGNGIRAAGNPDMEPSLRDFPTCPPPAAPTRRVAGKVTPEEKDSSDNKTGTSTTTDSAAATGSPSVEHPPFLQRGNSGPHPSFPFKLQRILDKLEAEQDFEVISWLSHGRAFLVHNVDRFVAELMPRYFNQTKYSSFQRQLHMYRFQRITAGRDKGAYHHPNFQRGSPELCFAMQRTRVNGKGTRRPGNPKCEPNLYVHPPLPPIAHGTAIEMPRHEQQQMPQPLRCGVDYAPTTEFSAATDKGEDKKDSRNKNVVLKV